MKKVRKNKQTVNELIGQFGVAFYSCFMVNDNVEVFSKRRNEENNKGLLWKSNVVNDFEIIEEDNIDYGTEIKVYIKKEYKEEYLNQYKVENIIKTYSKYIFSNWV